MKALLFVYKLMLQIDFKLKNSIGSITFLSLWFILCGNASFAQISGVISNTKGEELSFASVFVKGSTKGTSANSEGRYTLNLERGKHEIGFHYVGYRQQTKVIDYTGAPITINIILDEETYSLPELEINAAAEDPAYAIIRKAIQKRPEYKKSIRDYSCDAYIKSLIKLLEAPKMLMGDSIGTLDGILDSSGRGIIYLSESENKFFFESPSNRKEIMVSSRVSGNDNGFSFNRFGIVDFYENAIQIGRQIVNPIGDNAMSYYRYRLVSSYYDEDRRNINKIEVIPRRSEDPAFRGFIYILDQEWLIHSVDLWLSAGAAKIDLLDTIRIQQLYLPVSGQYWPLFQQTIDLKGGIFGFKFGGEILAISSNYSINQGFPEGFFDREIVKIEPLSNKKPLEYWQERRPIPLTLEEEEDFIQKDSLSTLWESKPWMDSVDRVRNEFKTRDLFFGYTYQNSYAGRTWSIKPVSEIFNAVQGWNLGLNGAYEKRWKEQSNQQLRLDLASYYGFSDEKFRYRAEFNRRFGGLSRSFINLKAGHEIKDMNPENTFPTTFNASLMLSNKQSITRFYESTYVKGSSGRNIGIGHFLRWSLQYEQRRHVSNTTEYSFSKSEVPYPANDDLGNPDFAEMLLNNNKIEGEITFEWRPGRNYISYPERRFYTGSKYPSFEISVRSALILSPESSRVNLASLRVYKDNNFSSIAGYLNYHFRAGYFLEKPRSYLDFQHFAGAETVFIDPKNHSRGFKLLPIYGASTASSFVHFQAEWHDQSYLFDKIPGVRKLGYGLVYGVNHLYTPEQGNWSELSIGIDKVGYKLFRLFRVDFVWAFAEWNYSRFGITVSSIVNPN